MKHGERGATTLDEMINICAAMQHKQARYWKTTNDLAKLTGLAMAQFLAFKQLHEEELEQATTLCPKLSEYQTGIVERLEELETLFRLWLQEVVMNRNELEFHEPYREIFRAKFTEDEIDARMKEAEELMGGKGSNRS